MLRFPRSVTLRGGRLSYRVRVATVAAIVGASIGLVATPARAEPSEWSFLNGPIATVPGATVSGVIVPIVRARAAEVATDPVAQFETVRSLRRSIDSCRRIFFNIRVIDSFGSVRSTRERQDRFSEIIDPSLRRGTYWLRVSCSQDETLPVHVVVCKSFTVQAGIESRAFIASGAARLQRDRCPERASGRLLALQIASTLENWLGSAFAVSTGLSGPAPEGFVTTTTRAPGGGGGGAPGGGGGAPGGGGGAADTAAPTVNSVNLTGSTYCQDVSVSSTVADHVGVTSATVSWSGSPGSGSMAMSGGGSSWSAVISPAAGFANPGVLNVTVTARDAAGNQGAGSSSIDLTLC